MRESLGHVPNKKSMFLSVPLIAIIFLVGILIGGVGIGGVLLVPSLKYLGGIPLHTAIPACMLSYIVTGGVGAWIYARHGSIQWAVAAKVCAGALPGAYLGAYLLPHINASYLEAGIALLLIFSGINTLIDRANTAGTRPPDNLTLVLIGFVTGIGSALSGTGGPLVLIPILVALKTSVLTAIGLSQAIQIPISIMATTGNLLHGELDIKLGIFIAAAIAGGAIVGAKTVHLVPAVKLKKLVSLLLVAVGIMMLTRLLWKFV